MNRFDLNIKREHCLHEFKFNKKIERVKFCLTHKFCFFSVDPVNSLQDTGRSEDTVKLIGETVSKSKQHARYKKQRSNKKMAKLTGEEALED